MSIRTLLVFLFPLANHPLLIGLVILSLTVIIAVALGIIRISSWLSYILVMVLLGGLLVIFVYISLLAPNETQISSSFTKTIIKRLTFIWIITITSSSIHIWTSKNISFINSISFDRESIEWIYLFYSSDLAIMTIFLVIYLFLTLIVVVFIRKTDSASLRTN